MSTDAIRDALKGIRAQFDRFHDGELARVHVGRLRANIDAALSTPQPSVSAEPVAWMDPDWPADNIDTADAFERQNVHPSLKWVPLYASPPPASAPYVPLSDAFAAGWRTAASWAKRDDLHADIGSPAYISDRDAAIDAAMKASP